MLPETKLNIFGKNNTVLNTSASSSPKFSLGSVIADKYRVEDKLGGNSGEADLYKVVRVKSRTQKNETMVLKLYRRKDSVKQEVLDALVAIKNANIAEIKDRGEIDGFAYIVMPFYENGSLASYIESGNIFDAEAIKTAILPSIADGLMAIHEKGIIHKDVKPSNLMVSDDRKHIVLIDFGISTATNGSTVVVTQTGKSPFYSAPETNTGLFLAESDYYSLGITLYELAAGCTPYQNADIKNVARYAQIQKIPYPEGFDRNLADLIDGLTYKDISNRNDKSNPNRRWGHEEIQKWLRGEKQAVPGSAAAGKSAGSDAESPSSPLLPYKLKNKTYRTLKELAAALMSDWEEGKKELGRGFLARHFDNMNDSARKAMCLAGEKMFAASKSEDGRDIAFFRLMGGLEPGIEEIYFKTHHYKNVTDYAEKLYAAACRLMNEDKKRDGEIADAASLFGSGALTDWAKNRASFSSLASKLEKITQTLNKKKLSALEKALFICHVLIGKLAIKIGDNVFSCESEISEYFSKLQRSDLEKFVNESKIAEESLKNIRKIYGEEVADSITKLLWNYGKLSNALNLTRKCPKCGKLAPDLAEYCLACGWRLADKDLSEWTCNSCHTVNRGKEQFCSKCGHKQGEEYHKPIICKSCGQELPYDAKACSHCLTMVKGNLLIEQIKKHKPLLISILVLIVASVAALTIWIDRSVANYIDQTEQNISKLTHALDVGQSKKVSPELFQALQVGQIIKFGSYPQNNSNPEPLEWRVLDIKNGKALIVTDKLIDARQFDNNVSNNDWEFSSMRSWLNNSFLNEVFSADQKKYIALSEIITDNQVTNDLIFLLSVEEAKKYFNNDVARIALSTTYAKNKVPYASSNVAGRWWLRSSGDLRYVTAYVNEHGFFNFIGGDIGSIRFIRAALWINIYPGNTKN